MARAGSARAAPLFALGRFVHRSRQRTQPAMGATPWRDLLFSAAALFTTRMSKIFQYAASARNFHHSSVVSVSTDDVGAV